MNKQKIFTQVLFLIYLLLLSWVILCKLAFSVSSLPHLRSINLIPFSQSVIVNGTLDFSEILQNCLAFIPVGIYISMLFPGWNFLQKILPSAGISLFFEAAQYLFAIGASDITDLISNTLGGVLGILCFLGLTKIWKEKTSQIINILALICTIGLLGLFALIFLAN